VTGAAGRQWRHPEGHNRAGRAVLLVHHAVLLAHAPRVSNDIAFAEALFRTAKYRPAFLLKRFADLDATRQWALRFVQRCNNVHRHSGIRYVTPTHVMPARTGICSTPVMHSIRMRGSVTHDAGADRPATGSQSPPSLSTPSETLLSRRPYPKSSFRFRSACLLSRHDLGQPQRRRATERTGGAEPPAAMHSVGSMASTRPSPQ
jgi:hypothetical protein